MSNLLQTFANLDLSDFSQVKTVRKVDGGDGEAVMRRYLFAAVEIAFMHCQGFVFGRLRWIDLSR